MAHYMLPLHNSLHDPSHDPLHVSSIHYMADYTSHYITNYIVRYMIHYIVLHGIFSLQVLAAIVLRPSACLTLLDNLPIRQLALDH